MKSTNHPAWRGRIWEGGVLVPIFLTRLDDPQRIVEAVTNQVREYQAAGGRDIERLCIDSDTWSRILSHYPVGYLTTGPISIKVSLLGRIFAQLLRRTLPPASVTFQASQREIQCLRKQMRLRQAVPIDGKWVKVELADEPS